MEEKKETLTTSNCVQSRVRFDSWHLIDLSAFQISVTKMGIKYPVGFGRMLISFGANSHIWPRIWFELIFSGREEIGK